MTAEFVNEFWPKIQNFCFSLISVCFCIYLIKNHLLDSEKIYILALKLILSIVLILNFKPIFEYADNSVIEMSNSIYPLESLLALQKKGASHFKSNPEESLAQKLKLAIDPVSYLSNGLVRNTDWISYWIIKIMERIRMYMGTFYFILIPPLLVLFIYDILPNLFNDAFSKLINILTWPILWHLLLRLGATKEMDDVSLDIYFIRIATILMILATPFLSSFLNIGSIASTAIRFGKTAPVNTFKKLNRHIGTRPYRKGPLKTIALAAAKIPHSPGYNALRPGPISTWPPKKGNS